MVRGGASPVRGRGATRRFKHGAPYDANSSPTASRGVRFIASRPRLIQQEGRRSRVPLRITAADVPSCLYAWLLPARRPLCQLRITTSLFSANGLFARANGRRAIKMRHIVS